MKIIISPSKKQLHVTENTRNFNALPKTIGLQNILKKMDRTEIGKLMKIKGDLLDTVFEDIHDFGKSMAKSIEIYQGVVFSELNTIKYTKSQLAYMNESLRILSALYGVLRPDTVISPYRLDMTMKPGGINLYDYWKDEIADSFSEESIIVSLASHEFEKLLDPIKDRVVQIDFKHKVPSYTLKKLRGGMLNQMIEKQVSSLKDLKKLEIDGFKYTPELSSDRKLVFSK